MVLSISYLIPMKNFFLTVTCQNFQSFYFSIVIGVFFWFFFLLLSFPFMFSGHQSGSDSCVCHCTSGVPVSPLLCSLWGELVLFWIPLSVWSHNSVCSTFTLCNKPHKVAACGRDSVCWPFLARLHRSGPTSLSFVHQHLVALWHHRPGRREALASSGTCCFSLAPLRLLWKVKLLPCKPATVHLWFCPKFWIWYQFVRRGVAPACHFLSF